MCLVDQAIEPLASPSQVEIDVRAERSRRRDERADRDTTELPAVDRGHQGSRDAGSLGDVFLASFLTDPERPELPSKSESIHTAMIAPVP